MGKKTPKPCLKSFITSQISSQNFSCYKVKRFPVCSPPLIGKTNGVSLSQTQLEASVFNLMALSVECVFGVGIRELAKAAGL